MIVVANWKNNKNEKEALDWCTQITELLPEKPAQTELVVCPPFPLIPTLKKNCPPILKLGAQNVSHLSGQTCTGEVEGNTLKGLVDYVIVGHSERRTLLKETPENIQEKITALLKVGITPLVCFSQPSDLESLTQEASPSSIILVYENPENISDGKEFRPADPAKIKPLFEQIKTQYLDYQLIYGGSVTPETASSFIKAGADGLLIGQASLDAKTFTEIIKVCVEPHA